MTCREFADFMADYFEGELAANVRYDFERHLRVCPNCRRYLAGYEQTVKLGKAAFADAEAALPDEVPEDLVDAILNARRR